MFHAGDQIENPVTGERLVFHETSAETNGERVVFETIVQPGGFVAAAHLHPFQAERFEVLAGTVGMRRGKEKVELHAGGRGRSRAPARRTSSGTRATTRRASPAP